MRRFAILFFCLVMCVVAFAACDFGMTGSDGGGDDQENYSHVHQLSFIEATEATCGKDGNIAYYYCNCGKYFSDEAASVEIADASSVLLPKIEHPMRYTFNETTHQKLVTCEHTDVVFPLETHSMDDDGICTMCGYQDGTIGLEYTLTADGTAYMVSDIGTAKGECIVIATQHKGKPVVGIAESAFANLTKLKEIMIPSSIESIGAYAFFDCVRLKSVVVPDSVTYIGTMAFYNCESLESITLPFVGETQVSDVNTHFGFVFGADSYKENVEQIPTTLKTVTITGGKIDNYTFYDCATLTSITLPDSVTSIGSYAFGNCTSLTSITLPDSVTSIGSYAFGNCTNLTSITLPDSVTSIGTFPLSGCTNLETIKLPFVGQRDSTTQYEGHFGILWGYNRTKSQPTSYHLEHDGYYYIYKIPSSLSCVVLSEKVTKIGAYAFTGCSDLETIVISDSVKSIDSRAFYRCESLDKVYISDLEAWCKIRMADSYSSPLMYADNFYLNGTLVTDLAIPNGITSINKYAFSCTSLTSITIPDSVTSIGSCAFYGCKGLTSITIPNSVTSIGSFAFKGCDRLTSITLPFVGGSATGKYVEACMGYIFSYDGGYVWGPNHEPKGVGPITINNSNYWFDIPSSLKTVVITGDTNIASLAFYGCKGLTSITIPSSVTSIDSSAFVGCTGLKTLTFAEGSKLEGIGSSAFEGCTGLTSITIPNSVTSIGSEAFRRCSSLTSITIPNSVTSIGSDAFYGCSKLTSITIPDSVTSIGSSAFEGCTGLTSITIPNSVTSIGSSAFKNCDNLTSITIPNSVTSIGSSAFYDCDSLTYNEYGNACYLGNENNPYLYLAKAKSTVVTSCTVHEDTRFIGSHAFNRCRSLTSITIPDSVTSIGVYAFGSCTGLMSVTIGNSVTSIGEYAFDTCCKLIEVYNRSSLSIRAGSSSNGHVGFWAKDVYTLTSGASKLFTEGDYIFYNDNGAYYLMGYCGTDTAITLPERVRGQGYAIYNMAFAYCTGLTSVTIGNSVTSIGGGAFRECDNLTSITIPDSVTSIGDSAFSSCYSLTSITIPDSVTRIGKYAFSSCTGLTSITIPNSVTRIGSYAFEGCTNLRTATFQNTSGWTINGTTVSSIALSNKSTAATCLWSNYAWATWIR